MRRAAITAEGQLLPEDRLTNPEIEEYVDTNHEWIRSRTGISERRILRDPAKATSSMATEAARDVLRKRGIGPEDVDLIIVATCSPDTLIPSAAAYVQAKLGATNAAAVDLNAACSGWIYALSVAHSMIHSGMARHVLTVGVDVN